MSSVESAFEGSYSKAAFRTLLEAYWPQRVSCLIAIALGFAGRALLLSNANWIGYWADSYCRAPQMCREIPWFLGGFTAMDYVTLLFYLTAIGFALTTVFRLVFARASAIAASRIYDEVTLRTSRYPMRFFDTNPAGRIITRFSSDYGNVFRLFGGPLAELISIVADLVCIVILMSLASIYFIPLLLVIALINFLVYQANRDRMRIERRRLSASRSPSVAHFAETVQGVTTIRAYLRSSAFGQRFKSLNNLFLDQKARTTLVLTLFSGQMNGVTSLLILAVGGVSLWLYGNGQISAGVIGVAFGFIALGANSLQMLFEWLAQLEEAMVGVERLDQYLRKPIEAGQSLPASARFATGHSQYDPNKQTELAKMAQANSPRPPVEVRFEDVWLRYDEELPFVLKGVSFTVRAGEKLGIVGRTGSGKSSLIAALFGLYPLHRGQICIDGQAARFATSANSLAQLGMRPSKSSLERVDGSIDLNVFRRQISLIAQEPVLFSGTLRENLGGEDEALLLQALHRVGLGEWLADYSGGLDGRIEERGRNLSLGERQLICMARCLLQRAPVVVMDEATSSVDPQSEEVLTAATRDFFSDRTQLIVAHRLSTLTECDRVLWLQGGEVKMIGPTNEVLPYFSQAHLHI